MIRLFFFFGCISMVLGCNSPDQPSPEPEKYSSTSDTSLYVDSVINRFHTSSGQLIYVPVYSHIYQRNRQKTFNLTATLSIRNADPTRDLVIKEVDYFDSEGNLVERCLDQPLTLRALSSTSFVIEEADLRGGVGANFMVRWQTDLPIYPPVVEAVMISTSMQQGISFISHSRVIEQQ